MHSFSNLKLCVHAPVCVFPQSGILSFPGVMAGAAIGITSLLAATVAVFCYCQRRTQRKLRNEYVGFESDVIYRPTSETHTELGAHRHSMIGDSWNSEEDNRGHNGDSESTKSNQGSYHDTDESEQSHYENDSETDNSEESHDSSDHESKTIGTQQGH